MPLNHMWCPVLLPVNFISEFQFYFEIINSEHKIIRSFIIFLFVCRWLIETCFPKSNGKIRCFELYSMYVGLTSAHTLLDYNRRLVAILRDNLADFNGFEC